MDSSRTHFELVGLGLEGQVLAFRFEALSSRKLPRPRATSALLFEWLKFFRSPENFFVGLFFLGDRLKKCLKTFFFFLENTCLYVHGFGHEHSCPWPRKGLSSEGLSLSLASDFFCVLGLEPCVLDSTSANMLLHENYCTDFFVNEQCAAVLIAHILKILQLIITYMNRFSLHFEMKIENYTDTYIQH